MKYYNTSNLDFVCHLSTSKTEVTEGESFTITLEITGPDAKEGLKIPYRIIGDVRPEDYRPSSEYGLFIIGNNLKASVTFTCANDKYAEGEEYFLLGLHWYPALEPILVVFNNLPSEIRIHPPAIFPNPPNFAIVAENAEVAGGQDTNFSIFYQNLRSGVKIPYFIQFNTDRYPTEFLTYSEPNGVTVVTVSTPFTAVGNYVKIWLKNHPSVESQTIILQGSQTGGIQGNELIISSNRLTTYNLYNEYIAAFGPQTPATEVTLKVLPEVYVIGTNTTLPAIDTRGQWFSGTRIKIINNGFILGRGGNGGRMSPNESISGGNGGTAIASSTNISTIVDNYGTIAGGGGGSCGMWYLTTPIGVRTGYLIGGCGGRPLGLGSTASSYDFAGMTIRKNGTNADLLTPGTLNSVNMFTAISGTSSGGDIGQAGSVSGTQGSVKSNTNGQAGYLSEGSVIIINKGSGVFYGRAV